MDSAFAFMEAMRHYPLEECHEPFVSMQEAAEGIEVVFSDTLLNRHFPRIYAIRSGLIPPFRHAARAMNERGWMLRIEDAYRSPEMQRAQSHDPRIFDLILKKTMWEMNGAVPSSDFLLRRFSALVATRCRIGTHISGSALDISVLDRSTGEEIDRGGSYLEISERTPMASPFLSEEQQRNRGAMSQLMGQFGWIAYPYEFWHYSSGDSYAESLTQSGQAARYGPVRYDGETMAPILEPESDALLEPLEFYQDKIATLSAIPQTDPCD